jgi:hypothetical protein
MTQSINKPEFKEQLAAYDAKKAIDKAFKPAPAVTKVQQGLVPAPKAAKTSPAKKSGRVVGISADENKLLKNLLETVQEDANYSIISSTEAFAKLQGRYNK